ncbi:MAG TPA: NAD(P) transhydrogenase subunit alpha [Acidimicrobiales bacterium]|nr:NAD(P) transhydrogenase subunit alpha [Acidimicrobiales bacterium]
MSARVAVPAETRAGETRVALTPDAVQRLVTDGFEVAVEQGAGEAATFTDAQYRDAGATLAPDAATACRGAGAVVRVNAPTAAEAALLDAGAVHLSFLQPGSSTEALRAAIERRASAVSFDLVPRISRAQSMDALSSQATVSGYRAALVGAQRLGKFFPMFMTAAGTVPPAKVLVMGVGVAGLQAIATSRRLGAAVRAYDVRAAAKEEAESLGATFVDLGVSAEGVGGYARELTAEELAVQQAALAAEVAASDVVITTAAVPGRRAPVLVTRSTVEQMGPGAVIVDMAADSGGNCEVTVPGEEVRCNLAVVIGLSNPPASMPTHASFLYARNVLNLLALYAAKGEIAPDWTDEVVVGATVLRDGACTNEAAASLLGVPYVPLSTATGGTGAA